MNELYQVFIYAFISLFSVVNPIGNSAAFLLITKGLNKETRIRITNTVALYSLIIICGTFFIGNYVLLFFGISLESVQIAGGIIVFKTAWDLFSGEKYDKSLLVEKNSVEKMIFFPLTMPLTAGAGAIAVTISLSANSLAHQVHYFSFALVNILAIFLVIVITTTCYRSSEVIFKKLGSARTEIITKMTAFIMLAIGITIFWNGLTGLISIYLKTIQTLI